MPASTGRQLTIALVAGDDRRRLALRYASERQPRRRRRSLSSSRRRASDARNQRQARVRHQGSGKAPAAGPGARVLSANALVRGSVPAGPWRLSPSPRSTRRVRRAQRSHSSSDRRTAGLRLGDIRAVRRRRCGRSQRHERERQRRPTLTIASTIHATRAGARVQQQAGGAIWPGYAAAAERRARVLSANALVGMLVPVGPWRLTPSSRCERARRSSRRDCFCPRAGTGLAIAMATKRSPAAGDCLLVGG
jgi:hypothetical protein